MSQIIRQKVEAGVIRPRVGTELLEQYMHCFSQSTYVDTPGNAEAPARAGAERAEETQT
jgi:hypothetical protein